MGVSGDTPRDQQGGGDQGVPDVPVCVHRGLRAVVGGAVCSECGDAAFTLLVCQAMTRPLLFLKRREAHCV